MMFDKDGKDNTQTNEADSLCKSCRFRTPETLNDYCRLDREFRAQVGICHNYYPEDMNKAENENKEV